MWQELGSWEEVAQSGEAVVKNSIKRPTQQTRMGYGAKEAERERIVDVIAYQGTTGHLEKLVSVVPVAIRTVALDIGETVLRLEGFDTCLPPKWDAEQA